QPFNQAPSLHIALLVILWVLYARHVPRWALWLLHPWFLLVGVSVLTTYQHHFIDIPTGALLGFLCLWLWPDRGPSPLATVAVTDAVALGRLPDRRVAAGFPTVIDLAAELPRPHEHSGWRSFPALDLVAPEPHLLRAAAAAIEDARARGRVLVCCALGYSRS